MVRNLKKLSRQLPLPAFVTELIRSNHETFNRLALNESVHNLGNVRSRDAPVKKVIGFD